MDIRKIKKLIELVEESGIAERKFLKVKSQYASVVMANQLQHLKCTTQPLQHQWLHQHR